MKFIAVSDVRSIGKTKTVACRMGYRCISLNVVDIGARSLFYQQDFAFYPILCTRAEALRRYSL